LITAYFLLHISKEPNEYASCRKKQWDGLMPFLLVVLFFAFSFPLLTLRLLMLPDKGFVISGRTE
jgi:hypothetical protein